MVVSHLGEIALPQAGASELDDPSSPSPLDKVRQRAMYGARVRSLSAPADRFLQELFVEHKICAFHVFIVHGSKRRRQCEERGAAP